MANLRIIKYDLVSWFCIIMFTFLSFNLIGNEISAKHDVMIPEEYTIDAETITALIENTEHRSKHQELRENRTLNTELMIITADSLETAFEELSEIKNEEGIVTEIVTLTTTGTTSSSIRNWLSTKKSSNSNLQYVILGGDEGIVPAHTITYPHAGTTETSTMDFYYSNVLSTWPQNNEIQSIDVDVDLYVGRLPVRNSTEVENYITKYENYRKNYISYTDRMNFISTNVTRDSNYCFYDNFVSNMISHTGDAIICDSLFSPDLVDSLNGAATAVIDMFQDRDYSFLYGCWHGIDSFCIYDSELNKLDPSYEQNWEKHKEYITINTNRVDEGGCYYDSVSTGEHAGEFMYRYSSPAECNYQLEDVIPDTYGNTYFLWMTSCMTMDMNYISSSMPCVRDSSNNVIVNSDITGWLFDVYVDSLPEPIINEENCINEVLFNEIGGPVAIYSTSALGYPSLCRYIVNEYMDLQFIDDEHELGYLTNTAWDILDSTFNIFLYRLLFIGHGLFGDPSMDVWSAEAKQLVLSKNIVDSPFSSTPTFQVYDTEGNIVEALVCVIDDDGVIQGKGMSPYHYKSTIDDDWIITANKANYIQDRKEYEYLKSYSTIPYTMDFENGLDKNWRIYPDSTYGRILVTTENDPYNGNMHLTMDSNTNGHYATNSAELHLNLTDKNRIILDFYWKEFNDETHTEDGVFLSDDNGNNYTKVYSLSGGSGWENIVLDLDSLITVNNLEYNNNFIIKFQQKDNYSITSDGFAFDEVKVYSMYSSLPYSTGFESGLDDYWTTESTTAHGRVQVTTANNPHWGIKHLTMDVDSLSNTSINRADLYLDLEDMSNVQLVFYWKDYKDQYENYDGIYFSEDGGNNFTKIYDLNGQLYTYDKWAKYTINVSTLAANASLHLTSQFVIRFQHYGDRPIASGGFAFDDISIDGLSRDEYKPEDGVVETNFNLKCYPNPFNPETKISYSLSRPSDEVSIKIYNIKGQLVKNFSNCPAISGNHSVIWNGRDNKGSISGSGVYFIQFTSNNQDVMQKVMLLK